EARAQPVGPHAVDRPQRGAGLDAVLASNPGTRKDTRDLLEVVEEEPLGGVAEPIRLPSPERVEGGEDALHLLRERRLRDAAVPDAEDLDLAVQRRIAVLVERTDDVVARRELRVRVEAPAGEADQ